MPRWDKMLTRAAVPKAGLGNLLVGGRRSGAGKGPSVATMNVSWQSPGQPQILDQDVQAFGEEAYLSQVYVMRCVQTIANTIAGLEFRAGPNPLEPQNQDSTSPLVQLLGPATPQAPGGPNPRTSARALWAWSICQYVVYGRFAWECQLGSLPDPLGGKPKKVPLALWPLVANCINAVPSQDGDQYFDKYVYTTPMYGDLTLKPEQVFYAWKPSLTDWRQPETIMTSAKLPIYIAKGLDRYMVKLLQNDMVASTLVVTPPFDEPAARRAWQEQFLTSFSGVDNRGKTIFAEAEYDEDDNSGKPLVQVEKIAQTAVEASLLEIAKTAKDEICVAMGVPLSLIGNAQERIYANAESEYKNFWVLTVMNMLEELQEYVNTMLAPRLGTEVGWFDLSRVAALQPPSVFAPPMIGDVINFGVASAAQVANVLGIPAATADIGASDTDTVEVGQESPFTGAGMEGNRALTRSEQARAQQWTGATVTKGQLIDARKRFENRPLNTANWDEPFRAYNYLQPASIVHLRSPESKVTKPDMSEVNAEKAAAERALETRNAHNERILAERRAQTADLIHQTSQQVEDVRVMAVKDRLASTVKASLAKVYPMSTLEWVDDADWDGPKQVNLDEIDMGRRPGGRDPAKTAGVTKGIAAGDPGALAPVVLVKTPSGEKHKIADGYHRTKGHERLGHGQVNAYVGTVDEDEGPWDKEMHDKKLNRALVEGLEVRAGVLQEPHKCKYCKDPATKASVWADGRAFIPTCDAHLSTAHHRIKVVNNDEVDRVVELPQKRSVAVDRAAFHLGRSDKAAGKEMMSKAAFSASHPTADADDYPLYEAGFTSDEKDLDVGVTPQRRNGWLPEQPLDLLHCAHCGDRASIVKQSATGPLPLCNNHASMEAHPERGDGSPVTMLPYSGTDLEQWVSDNEVALLELAEQEDAAASA